jgi:hypothetical protein
MSSFSDELGLYEMEKCWVRIAGAVVTTDGGDRLEISVITPMHAYRKLPIVLQSRRLRT